MEVKGEFVNKKKLTVLHRLCNHKMTIFMLCHTFTLLKFIFVEDKNKKKTSAYPLLLITIKKLIDQTWAITLMDNLTDDRPLTVMEKSNLS